MKVAQLVAATVEALCSQADAVLAAVNTLPAVAAETQLAVEIDTAAEKVATVVAQAKLDVARRRLSVAVQAFQFAVETTLLLAAGVAQLAVGAVAALIAA